MYYVPLWLRVVFQQDLHGKGSSDPALLRRLACFNWLQTAADRHTHHMANAHSHFGYATSENNVYFELFSRKSDGLN